MFSVMILDFKDRTTERFFHGDRVAKFNAFAGVAARKLDLLNTATRVDDLRSPPGNRLEALKGNRQGQHSIRINDQWRICFVWTQEGPTAVEIADYHR